jgi:hypothetical protein
VEIGDIVLGRRLEINPRERLVRERAHFSVDIYFSIPPHQWSMPSREISLILDALVGWYTKPLFD